MDLNIDQPIAALASPPGGSLRGIVRISGETLREVMAGWFQPDNMELWNSSRTAFSHSGRVCFDLDSEPIQCPVEILFWPNRRSYTGQPVVEIHLPGSPCLLEAALSEAYRHGARPARPGEFTLRAFLAGKLDLLQAEAVLSVIDAQDQVELETALSQLAGGISGKLTLLRRDLIELLADLEAGLDFVDEDIEFVSRSAVIERLSEAHRFIDHLLQQANSRMQTRSRSKVVLAGLPNAGKSTLFNDFVGTNSALVSSEKGTTRDFLTCPINWNGLSFDLIDTAGWEETSAGIAAVAQAQRTEQLEHCDLILWCSAASQSESEQILDNELFIQTSKRFSHVVRLITKADQLVETNSKKLIEFDVATSSTLAVSVHLRSGLTELKTLLKNQLSSNQTSGSQWLGMTAARCRETLETTVVTLSRVVNSANVPEFGDELIAVELRHALDQIGVILGVIYTDDILDRVFSKFCIGK